MSTKKAASSLLEFLTTPNPLINALGAAEGRNTSSRAYYAPKEMKAWDDFNFETLKSIYGSKLMEELEKDNRHLAYPFIWHKHEAVMEDESTTSDFLIRWNQAIVNQALEAVEDTLHPCVWTSRRRRAVEESSTSLGVDEANPRVRTSSIGNTKLKRDTGAISTCGVCQERDERRSNGSLERLPKEVKPGSKWTSAEINRFIDTNRKLQSGVTRRDEVLPIMQAYSYCVDHGCRYGCILTYREAFIFRIGVTDEAKENNNAQNIDRRLLTKLLKRHGIMEYVSIPWDDSQNSEDEDSRQLSLNLSLWFIHILAGNNHEVAWEYGKLQNEILVQQPCRLSTEVDRELKDLSFELREAKRGSFPAERSKRQSIRRSSLENDKDEGDGGEGDYYSLSFQSTSGMATPRTMPDYLHRTVEENLGESDGDARTEVGEPSTEEYHSGGKRLRRSLRNANSKRQKM